MRLVDWPLQEQIRTARTSDIQAPTVWGLVKGTGRGGAEEGGVGVGALVRVFGQR